MQHKKNAPFALTLALILALCPRVVRAQDPPGAKDYLLGEQHYEAGQYEEARRHFALSYQLSRKPDLLLNLGRVNARLHQHLLAADLMEHFLLLRPQDQDRDRIRVEIAIARHRAAAPLYLMGGGAALLLLGAGLSIPAADGALQVPPAESARPMALSGISLGTIGVVGLCAGAIWAGVTLLRGKGRSCCSTLVF